MLDPEQTTTMLANVKQFYADAGNVAPFIAVDEEGGTVVRVADNEAFGAQDVGDASALGSAGDTEAAKRAAEQIADYLMPLGFNLDFAPVADVVDPLRSDTMGLRSFSSDAAVAADMVRAEVEGFRDKKMLCCAKHFPGIGAAAGDSHEGAITMVDGKAKLMRDDYCDGLGDCLPTCPTGAITFVEREAAAYDEQAVMENKQRKMRKEGMTLPCGCPGSQSRNIQRQNAPTVEAPQTQQMSRLSQWPVQIKLVPVNAPYFDGARLLIAADCTAYAYAAFHERFIKGHITLVGCPKLDSVDYAEKLTEIIRENDIKSVTVVRMEVPCCGGLELAAKKALRQSGKFIPWQVVTVTVDGRLVEE